MKIKNKTAICGLMLALAIVIGYIEAISGINSFIPLPPGIKLGLPNIIIVIMLSFYSTVETFYVLIARCILTCILFGSITSLIFSLSGGISAFLITVLLIKSQLYNKHISLIGISICSAAMHNIGQISAAVVIFKSASVFYYLPTLLFSSVVTGFITGFTAWVIVKRLELFL